MFPDLVLIPYYKGKCLVVWKHRTLLSSDTVETLCVDKGKLIFKSGITALDLRNWFGGPLREIMIPLTRSHKTIDHSSKVKQKPPLGKLNKIAYLLRGGEGGPYK